MLLCSLQFERISTVFYREEAGGRNEKSKPVWMQLPQVTIGLLQLIECFEHKRILKTTFCITALLNCGM